MKYLKYYEYNSNKFYNEITIDEYNNLYKRYNGHSIEPFTKTEKDTLKDKFNLNFKCYTNLLYIDTISNSSSLTNYNVIVCKSYDDWFLVEWYIKRNNIKYFICDQFDGLLNFIENIT